MVFMLSLCSNGAKCTAEENLSAEQASKKTQLEPSVSPSLLTPMPPTCTQKKDGPKKPKALISNKKYQDSIGQVQVILAASIASIIISVKILPTQELETP